MKLFINHDNQKIEVSNKCILIPCKYTPNKDIWFSCELPMKEAVCGTI